MHSMNSSKAARFEKPDPGQVVLDEVLGMLMTLLLNPVGWGGAFLGFLLFRAADIVKPYPANKLEALHGGTGLSDEIIQKCIKLGCHATLCPPLCPIRPILRQSDGRSQREFELYAPLAERSSAHISLDPLSAYQRR